jgi:hypothetical protein
MSRVTSPASSSFSLVLKKGDRVGMHTRRPDENQGTNSQGKEGVAGHENNDVGEGLEGQEGQEGYEGQGGEDPVEPHKWQASLVPSLSIDADLDRDDDDLDALIDAVSEVSSILSTSLLLRQMKFSSMPL